jgi:hypothetical protein
MRYDTSTDVKTGSPDSADFARLGFYFPTVAYGDVAHRAVTTIARTANTLPTVFFCCNKSVVHFRGSGSSWNGCATIVTS